MATKKKPKEEVRRARNSVYRQHIIAAAEQVFADRGFENAKVQEISDLAGLSMGTIYAIFPGKTDLLRAVLDERGQEILGAARQCGAADKPPREALYALIECYIDYFVAHPSFLRMHLRQGTSWALTPAPDADSQVRHSKQVHLLQAELFRRGIKDEVFVDEDPAYLAKMFSAMDQALLADWVEGGMKTSREQLVRRLQDMVTRAFCRAAS